jgi:hypothetical protein
MRIVIAFLVNLSAGEIAANVKPFENYLNLSIHLVNDGIKKAAPRSPGI